MEQSSGGDGRENDCINSPGEGLSLLSRVNIEKSWMMREPELVAEQETGGNGKPANGAVKELL